MIKTSHCNTGVVAAFAVIQKRLSLSLVKNRVASYVPFHFWVQKLRLSCGMQASNYSNDEWDGTPHHAFSVILKYRELVFFAETLRARCPLHTVHHEWYGSDEPDDVGILER